MLKVEHLKQESTGKVFQKLLVDLHLQFFFWKIGS